MKLFINFLFVVLFLSDCSSNSLIKDNASFGNNQSVPDTTTAIKIAVSKWLPLFGKKIFDEKPYIAILQGDSLWIITGSLPTSSSEIINGDTIFHIVQGGVAYIKIRKNNGEVIDIGHGK